MAVRIFRALCDNGSVGLSLGVSRKSDQNSYKNALLDPAGLLMAAVVLQCRPSLAARHAAGVSENRLLAGKLEGDGTALAPISLRSRPPSMGCRDGCSSGGR